MSTHQLLYLSRADVEAIGVTMREIIDALAIAPGMSPSTYAFRKTSVHRNLYRVPLP